MWATICPQNILSVVAKFYNFSPTLLRSRTRIREVVRARWAFLLICRDKKHTSWPEIGRVLNKHHTTCMSGHKRALLLKSTDLFFEQEISFIESLISKRLISMTTVTVH